MTSLPLDQTEAAPDVRDLDGSAVLDAVVAARRAADAEEARLLAVGGALGGPAPGHPRAPGRVVPDPACGWSGVGAGAVVLRAGTAGGHRDARGGGVRGRGARRRVEPVALRGVGVGVRGGGALLPAPAAVG